MASFTHRRPALPFNVSPVHQNITLTQFMEADSRIGVTLRCKIYCKSLVWDELRWPKVSWQDPSGMLNSVFWTLIMVPPIYFFDVSYSWSYSQQSNLGAWIKYRSLKFDTLSNFYNHISGFVSLMLRQRNNTLTLLLLFGTRSLYLNFSVHSC